MEALLLIFELHVLEFHNPNAVITLSMTKRGRGADSGNAVECSALVLYGHELCTRCGFSDLRRVRRIL